MVRVLRFAQMNLRLLKAHELFLDVCANVCGRRTERDESLPIRYAILLADELLTTLGFIRSHGINEVVS